MSLPPKKSYFSTMLVLLICFISCVPLFPVRFWEVSEKELFKRSKTLESGIINSSLFFSGALDDFEISDDNNTILTHTINNNTKTDTVKFIATKSKQVLSEYSFTHYNEISPVIKILNCTQTFVVILTDGTIIQYSLNGIILKKSKVVTEATRFSCNGLVQKIFALKERTRGYTEFFSQQDKNPRFFGLFIIDLDTLKLEDSVPFVPSQNDMVEIIESDLENVIIAYENNNKIKFKVFNIETKTFSVQFPIEINTLETNKQSNVFIFGISLFLFNKFNQKIRIYIVESGFSLTGCKFISYQKNTQIMYADVNLFSRNLLTGQKNIIYSRKSKQSNKPDFNRNLWEHLTNKNKWQDFEKQHVLCLWKTTKNGLIYMYDPEDQMLLTLK